MNLNTTWACGRYSQFVKALEEASRDSLEFIKEKAIKSIFDMLRAKPEQEAFLLTALVNKLGDPSRKLASKVSPSNALPSPLPYRGRPDGSSHGRVQLHAVS